MSIVQAALTRTIPALSELLQRSLVVLPESSQPVSDGFVVRFTTPRVTIVPADGEPFTPPQRRFLGEMFELVRAAHDAQSRYHDLEQRLVLFQRENVALAEQNRTLTEIAVRDTLTGLYNRTYVVEKLESEINRALRHGSPTAVLMIDLDHFKRINDTYGHVIGDKVLQWFGRTLRESCRIYDVPGRYGGEEFCVLLPDTPASNTTTVAERIRARLAETELKFGEAKVNVTASFGIAGLDRVPDEALLNSITLIDRADRALYAAKHRGRNRIETWSGEVEGEISH